jgi:Tfp pilus assembly protein PilN
MAQFDLNLSTKPFPAYRLFNAALAVLLVVLVLISAWQAYGFIHFSSLARSIRADERTVRAEADGLGQRLSELESRLDRPEAAAKLNEIGFLNQLIARKRISWAGLFANLEDMVPESVRLVSLRPSIDRAGAIVLSMQIEGRSIADVSQFVNRLEQSPVFEKIEVSVEEKRDPTATTDVQISLTANYYPERDTK